MMTKAQFPSLNPDHCKGCLRCVTACNHDCITEGESINPLTGQIPVMLHLENCSGCGLCIEACPEPYGLATAEQSEETAKLSEVKTPKYEINFSMGVHNRNIPLEHIEPLVLKGTYASAIGAILAGCRNFYGYPITPSTEGAEQMAKLLPEMDGIFIQAVSEVAAVNMLYGCGGAGKRSLTYTSSPGFSLMLEGVSYLIGAEVPAVIVNLMRGGPGLGNIAPEQADIKLACRGLGHGNTQAIVLAPSTPQEMLDMTILSFDLAFKYRNPVIILGDGFLGQMTGKITLPDYMIEPAIPDWAVYGEKKYRQNLITSIQLNEADLERHNHHLNRKYRYITDNEQRYETFMTDDADILFVACNSPSQMTKGAVRELRKLGIKAGLFKPLTLWPFPIKGLVRLLDHIKTIVVVEASNGQLEDELRLALSHANLRYNPNILHVRRFGGILPQLNDIMEIAFKLEEVEA